MSKENIFQEWKQHRKNFLNIQEWNAFAPIRSSLKESLWEKTSIKKKVVYKEKSEMQEEINNKEVKIHEMYKIRVISCEIRKYGINCIIKCKIVVNKLLECL